MCAANAAEGGEAEETGIMAMICLLTVFFSVAPYHRHLDFALDTYPYFGEREDTIMGKSSIRIRDSFKTPAAVTETEMVVHTNFETGS